MNDSDVLSTRVRDITNKTAAIELNAADSDAGGESTPSADVVNTKSATSLESATAGSENLPSVERSSSVQRDTSPSDVTQDAAKPLNIPSVSVDSGPGPNVPSILPLAPSTSFESTNNLNTTSLSTSPSMPFAPEVASEITIPVSFTSAASFPLTPEELDCAKDLVLDLLGWGVAPEYLIESGVSAQAIFRIFTDLNLRLPANCVPSDDVKSSLWP